MNQVIHYICTGGCGGVVTEEEYQQGKTTCGANDCPKYGQPFERRGWCEQCKVHYNEEGGHAHQKLESPKRMNLQRILIWILAVIVFMGLIFLFAVGVTSKLRQGNPGSSVPKPTERPLPPPGTVEVGDYEFYPRTISAKYGDTITWKNIGTADHTVTFRSLSKTLTPGESWSWTIGPDIFSRGDNPYWCDFHRNQGMQALLVAE